jgi:hypothetical protein
MRLLLLAGAALAAAGCAMPGLPGMDPMGMARSSSTAQLEAQGASMMAAQANAQAAANRPGDEALSCDALQAELTTIMKDPAFQAAVASMGVSAQEQQARVNAAQASAAGLGATSIATGIASSFIPGMGWLGQAAMQAQMASAAAQMPAADRARAQMMGDMTTMMPTLYRGQRLHELATAKKCTFVNSPSPS